MLFTGPVTGRNIKGNHDGLDDTQASLWLRHGAA